MVSELVVAANAAGSQIPALQEQVSRSRLTLDRPVEELFDHLQNLFPYVNRDDARGYHYEQFAELARALARWADAGAEYAAKVEAEEEEGRQREETERVEAARDAYIERDDVEPFHAVGASTLPCYLEPNGEVILGQGMLWTTRKNLEAARAELEEIKASTYPHPLGVWAP